MQRFALITSSLRSPMMMRHSAAAMAASTALAASSTAVALSTTMRFKGDDKTAVASSSSSSSPASPAKDDTAAHTDAYAEAAAILDSLKKKDFNAAQAHVVHLAQSTYSEEYTIPIACCIVILITFYWARSTHYSAIRLSDAQTANHIGAVADLQKRLDDVTKTTTEGLGRRSKAMDTVQQANGELTTVIDQMTAALRQC